ncbi:unannotated protein [freshwater metagenome]|uniref:Unannotated protein n=1 Tax=freshwater metagenome TaxID=449393 RepID=A0A6J7LTS0_9ZZZZ
MKITRNADSTEVIPRVAMNEFTRNFTTMKPLTAPMIVPMRTPAITAGIALSHPALMMSTVLTPASAAVAPIERSNCPVTIGMSSASAAIAAMDCVDARMWTVDIVGNVAGAMIENTTMNTASR